MTPMRRNRLILVAISVIVLAWLVYMALSALLPFLFASAIVYLLLPIVRFLEGKFPWRESRPQLSRIAGILMVYLLVLGVAAGMLALIVPPTIQQTAAFVDAAPELYDAASEAIEGLNQELGERLPEEIRLYIEQRLASAGDAIFDAAQTVIMSMLTGVFSALSVVLALVAVPFFLFFLLRDRESLAQSAYGLIPAAYRYHVRNIVHIVNRILSSYVRAQVVIAIAVGIMVTIATWLLGLDFPILLGITAGIFEFVPIIGPIIGAIPAVLVALAVDPIKAIWVVLVYTAIQQLESYVLVPRIQGQAVRVNPAVILVAVIIGSEIMGIWGVLLAVPVTALAKDIYKYFYDEWKLGAVEPESLEHTDKLQGLESVKIERLRGASVATDKPSDGPQ